MTTGDLQPAFNPAEEEISNQGHRLRFIILAVVAAAVVGFMVYVAFPGNTQYFLTVGEFVAGEEYQDGQTVRVSGKLVEESFDRPDDSTVSYFQLADKDGATGHQLHASYVGVMPDLFFNPHSEIILEGRWYTPEQVFEADNILVKCPSKYQALEEQQRQQEELGATSG